MFFYQSNDNRVDELNKRIQGRLNPSSVAPVSFSPRPVSTKYALFPLIDHVPRVETPIDALPIPSFLPADSAPFAGFNVQQESKLQRRVPLQRDSSVQYFPASSSDLFQTHVPVTKNLQTHPFLFATVKGYSPQTERTPLPFNNVRMKKSTPLKNEVPLVSHHPPGHS